MKSEVTAIGAAILAVSCLLSLGTAQQPLDRSNVQNYIADLERAMRVLQSAGALDDFLYCQRELKEVWKHGTVPDEEDSRLSRILREARQSARWNTPPDAARALRSESPETDSASPPGEPTIPVRLPDGELNRSHPWWEDHQMQELLNGMFRGILAIPTPDPTNMVSETQEDGAFSVVWEDWSEYDLAERLFTERMTDANATPAQAWQALRFSHRLRVSLGQIMCHYFLSGNTLAPDPSPDDTRETVISLQQSVDRILERVDRLSARAPLSARLANLARQDLEQSRNALRRDQRLLPLQWAKDAERTAKSAEALSQMELKWKASNIQVEGIRH